MGGSSVTATLLRITACDFRQLGEDHGQSYTGMQHVEQIRCISRTIQSRLHRDHVEPRSRCFSWLATSLERFASHSCCGSLSTALIAADQPERDDPEAIEKKFVVMISPAAAVLVSSAIEKDSTAPRFHSDYLSACTVA